MFYSIDIGFDAVGPHIVKLFPNETIRCVSKPCTTTPAKTPIAKATVTFPNDMSLSPAEIKFADGGTIRGHLDIVSTVATIYQNEQTDGTLQSQSAGGTCYCIETTCDDNDGWDEVIRSIVLCLFRFGRQGQFSINTFAHEQLPAGIAPGPLTNDQADELQNTNQRYIFAHQAQRSLNLKQQLVCWSQDDVQEGTMVEAVYSYVWGLGGHKR